MLGAWYFVILIDSTYKTNIYNKPLVQLIGVTPFQKQLELLLGERVLNAFVTDKEGGLDVALREVFPKYKHLMCVWHMKRNIEAKFMQLTRNKEEAENFIKGPWNKVLNTKYNGSNLVGANLIWLALPHDRPLY
ncbi:hypothetical protein LINGRAPRIM_LOCUS166 [Linum grandiflorum]